MLNKEEIIYNSRSLVDTWLCNIKDIESIWIEMCGDKGSDIYPCTVANCGDIVGGLLYNNNGKYNVLKVCVNVKGEKKNIGSIDIV